MFTCVRDLALAEEQGRTSSCTIRKVPGQATVSGNWADLSMAAGIPPPQYYAAAPLEAATLNGFKGILHGDNKSPSHKFLTHLGLVSQTAAFVGRYILMDYLLYYPFIDGDSLDQQDLINDVVLPRYTDGKDVMVMAVASAPTTQEGSFFFNYTDDKGVARVSPTQSTNTTAANIATIITSQQAVNAGGRHFLPLTSPSLGVRSIQSIQMVAPCGGLFALVLVKPLFDTVIQEASTMCEQNLLCMKPVLPRILDGAYLGMIVQPSGTIAGGALVGYAKFAWGDFS